MEAHRTTARTSPRRATAAITKRCTRTEFSSINPNTHPARRAIPIVYTWLGDANNNGLVEHNELGRSESQCSCRRANTIDPDLRNPKNDEIMFAFQREVTNNVSFNVDWIQRWFNDQTVNQNCFGIPAAPSRRRSTRRRASSPTPDRTTSSTPATSSR